LQLHTDAYDRLRGKNPTDSVDIYDPGRESLNYLRINVFLFPLAVFMFLSHQRYFISEVEFCGNITEQIILENGDTFRLTL